MLEVQNKKKLKSFIISVTTLKELCIDVYDIVQMLPYPIHDLIPNENWSEYDNGLRLVYFVPGKEKKYLERMKYLS